MLHLDRVALRVARRVRADVLIDAAALELMFSVGLCAAARRDAAIDDTLDVGLLACDAVGVTSTGVRWLPMLHVDRCQRHSMLVVSAPLPEPLLTARRKNLWCVKLRAKLILIGFLFVCFIDFCLHFCLHFFLK